MSAPTENSGFSKIENVFGPNKFNLKRLVAEQHMLMREKVELEKMLKNVHTMRNKLKVEQIQFASLLREELRSYEDAQSGLASSSSKGLESAVTVEAAAEQDMDTCAKPNLDLRVPDLDRMFYGNFFAREGEDAPEEEEEEDEDSDDQLPGAAEMEEYRNPEDF